MKNNLIQCDICGSPLLVNSGHLYEKELDLTYGKGNTEHVTVTFIHCDTCGKDIAVLVDNEESQQLLSDVKHLYLKKMRFTSRHKPVPAKLDCKCRAMDTKLDRLRRDLAKRFDGALYQSEGNTIQLDYRYHAR